MIVSNWSALLLLLILGVLLLLVIFYIAKSLRDWRRTPNQSPAKPSLPAEIKIIQFQTNGVSSADATQSLTDAQEAWDRLTKREKQVARLAAQRKTDAEIASELNISERTVGNHLYSVFDKLEIHSRHELKYIIRQIDDDP